MPTISDPAPTKIIALRILAVAGVVGVLAIIAPVIAMAVHAGLGLLAVGAIAIVGIGAFQAMPLLGQKWENKLLALRKTEARKNPIEQLQNFLLEKALKVRDFKAAVTSIGAQIKNMQSMLEERIRSKPNYDASKQMKAIQAMTDGHAVLVVRYKDAEKALSELKDVIEDQKFAWEFGKVGQAAISQLNAASGEELMNEMLADEAFSSVRDNFNQVFAALELEATKLSNAPSLSYDEGMTLDLSNINLTNKQPVFANLKD
ncbi:MAG: hypothetical protein Q7S87_16100 [Agitococcus sp.]|nr:hypothetical protein [Agitococcus sp.]MDO9179073.1 hypothetical protein [Agitococcus sp.]